MLSETAEFCYKRDDIHHPNDEGGLMWNDSTIGIAWPEVDASINLSDKDTVNPSFEEFRAR